MDKLVPRPIFAEAINLWKYFQRATFRGDDADYSPYKKNGPKRSVRIGPESALPPSKAATRLPFTISLSEGSRL